MNKSIIKIAAIALIVICGNSIPAFAYERNVHEDVKISNQDEFKLEDNWLNREVAVQLNKNLKDVTEQDFLLIKRIDLHYKRIEDEIPKSISLLKNLEYLNLNYCKLTKVSENIIELKKLAYLDLGDNKFRELPEEFEQKMIKGEYPYIDVESRELRLKEDWHFLKGKWFYMDRYGDKLTGIKDINGKTYNFNEDGALKTGWDKIEDKWYYYDKCDSSITNSWRLISGKWYYFNEKAEMQIGLITIDSKKYYLNENGEMFTGWKILDGKSYFFDSYGVMKNGWMEIGNEKYYFDDNGAMVVGQERVIDGKKYKFYAEGTVAKNIWIDDYTYVQANQEVVNTYYNYAHSNTQYNSFKYMTDVNNQVSINNTAINLHNGIESNNCVYFLSEILRRSGVSLPNQTCNTYQLEKELQSRGFVASYDFTQLKPGDILFTNGYTHVYMFMCWKNSEYAYIVDNQREKFENNVLHMRNVLYDDSTYSTDRATHFYYYPY